MPLPYREAPGRRGRRPYILNCSEIQHQGESCNMKGKVSSIFLILIFLAGLSLLLYPSVSNYINSLSHSQLITDYAQQVEQMEEDQYAAYWEEARAYNESLLDRVNQNGLTEAQEGVYFSMLDTTGKGVMAYVEIPSIGVMLPICHGTEDDTLMEAVGHMKWSSLPVGGESTHCVISGHRGLPSSELFTNIDHLDFGDTFVIHVLGEELSYRVDHIATVDPYDYTLLAIEEGKDYVTLVTCTPYGINSHRLLVRGVRVQQNLDNALDTVYVANEVTFVDLSRVVPGAMAVLIAVAFVILLLGGKKRKGGKDGDEAET